MIAGSLLLILVAATLLALGLASGSSMLLIGSIGMSLLAAIALVVGIRRLPAEQLDGSLASKVGDGATEAGTVSQAVDGDEVGDDEDPPDEPAAQQLSPDEAARIAGLTTEVMVVDDRPRYHVAGCTHLAGREAEPLPVAEAVELGFSPCSLCQPQRTLLADAPAI